MGCKNRSSHLSLLETLTTFVSTPSLDTSGTITTTSKYPLAFRGTRERQTSEPKLSPSAERKKNCQTLLTFTSLLCVCTSRLKVGGHAPKACAASLSVVRSSGKMCLTVVHLTAVFFFFILRTCLVLLPRPTRVLETPEAVNDRCRHSAKNLRLSKATASIVPFCELSSSGSSLGFSVAGFRGFLALVFTHGSALGTTTRSCRAEFVFRLSNVASYFCVMLLV